MPKRHTILILLLAALTFSACASSETSTPPPTSAVQPTATSAEPSTAPDQRSSEPKVVISEVLTGAQGNNNYEFIELYNSGDQEAIDLKGWSLWYRLGEDQDEILMYRWAERTLIPPLGHYLLGRAGQEFGLPLDGTFEGSMVPPKGGLLLRNAQGEAADSLAWGSGPQSYAEGILAPTPENGISLERAPGGAQGNYNDTNDNAADFKLNSDPQPQNVGSAVTPQTDRYLEISLEAPETVEPGEQFEYALSVSNRTEGSVHDLTVELPLPQGLDLLAKADTVEIVDRASHWGTPGVEGSIALWQIDSLDAGKTVVTHLEMGTPWTYLTARVANYFVSAADWPSPAFGAPVRTAVEGGVIPIETVRELIGAELTIEGTATMYTSGYYAGGGNVKFYLEDDSGGIQVWVPGGEGQTRVAIGQKVRVSGELELYRGAVELVTQSPEDVEILAEPSDESSPTPVEVSIPEARHDREELPGRLVAVEGLVTRVEEFSYSYEIDLTDDQGEVLTLYVDKLTNMSVETVEVGQSYRAAGILEVLDDDQQLYPRLQSDLERIYPPVLLLEVDAPITVTPGELLTVTLTATNHTPEAMTDLLITATLPVRETQLETVFNGGDVQGNQVVWSAAQLAGAGSSLSVGYLLRATAPEGHFTLADYQATATQWTEPATGEPHYVFLGDSVPVWAIQGAGARSPYVFDPVTTAGTVTGVFPELGGFWIQETQTDADPLTSAGLFINTEDAPVEVQPGDNAQVSGVVRESNQHTQVRVAEAADITVLEEGNALPNAVELDPPVEEGESNAYYEALEGMLVQVSGPAVAVAPTTKYGEYALVLPRHDVERLWQGQDNGHAILVDDGSYAVHDDRSTLAYTINSGDQVSGLVGPLAFTFGRYKIEPVTAPRITKGSADLPALTPTGTDEFSIMTWNVENLFDFRAPHPDSPEPPSLSEYQHDIAKVANTIVAAGAPTIVALQEMENIEILEDVAAHEALVDYDYRPVLIEGTDSRGIDNGYLVRGDRAEILEVQQFIAPEGLTSRPPLMIKVEVTTDLGSLTLYALNNHFTSMSGGVEATEPRRNAQAAWNVSVMETLLADDPDAHVAILGDLNSFYNSLPIETLRQAGLEHVFEVLPEEQRYTYIFEGASQALDHILVTPTLMDMVRRVELLRVNADYALPEPGDETPRHKSDHDPLVATFSLEP